jgi:hypothetical protein
MIISDQRSMLTLFFFFFTLRFNSMDGQRKGKRQLERPRSRWIYNVKIEFREIGCEMWTGKSGGMLLTR